MGIGDSVAGLMVEWLWGLRLEGFEGFGCGGSGL